MSQVTIKVDNAVKKFDKYTVLDHVNITCNKGEICGIVGRNGSGKTVLFKSICGFVKLNEGTITVNGKVMGKDMKVLKKAGIIIEEPGFLRNKSGMKNLEYLYMINNKRDKKYLRSVMENVGLDPYSRKKVGKYSLGMRQRLAIAQATMEDQDIIILDEPMNGLDNHGVQEVREYLLQLKKQGKTILIASHNREDIDVLCDKVYEMDNGRVISEK
ncbi:MULTISPECIES: ATP-binding cassette domain-containing protein [unclassified Eubacterium (in: firmicutes)]|uniref:ABC transporter ATP-binding protein n=1 Tax=Eubacterium TaxID=1730 RepID=UPI0018F4158E|nr:MULTISPECIES: ATP-binding cassette domain-containing protein [unclassified Eubacterium (in: firmicutes)]